MLNKILYKKTPWTKSVLGTDGYKWSMFAGGRPFEKEVFYLSFRRGGLLHMPVDPEKIIREMIPTVSDETLLRELALLNGWGFNVTLDMLRSAIDGSQLEIVYATPKGEWVAPREPVITLRGPQALVSWLEPLIVGRFTYQMQVSTAYLKACSEDNHDEFIKRISKVTCQQQKELTLEAIGNNEDAEYLSQFIEIDEQGYYDRVQEQGQKLIATGVSPDRIFEVGLRAATCMEQHLIALKALKDIGFTLTSNCYGAYVLDMKGIGTLGHEGVMRWGGDDEIAFRKHIEALPQVTMLLDTTDTMKVGIPLALKLMQEFPDRNDGGRPDSGNLPDQFRLWVRGIRENNIRPRPWVFEDGLDDVGMREYEILREEVDYPKDQTFYGLGGYFIDRPEFTGFRRGVISMIYKLSWTLEYGPAMKFGDEVEEGESGKQSLPGILMLAVKDGVEDSLIICQYPLTLPGYRTYALGDGSLRRFIHDRPPISLLTKRYVDELKERRQQAIKSLSGDS